MVAGIFHSGSGLGDQLFRYITARTLALDKGFEFGVINPENFKGKDFMNLDMGIDCERWKLDDFAYNEWNEKKVIENRIDISSYDPEINFVEDNTIIDGNFEDIKYWGHRLAEIRDWLKVEPLERSNNVCVINFRGGEYSSDPNLFLTQEYWQKAIKLINDKYLVPLHENNFMKFEVHTDDPILAHQFFPDPDFLIIKDIGFNWRSIRYAKHLILSNSAFGILPALLNENVKEVIAPRYHARRNIKIWARPACYYPKFIYV